MHFKLIFWDIKPFLRNFPEALHVIEFIESRWLDCFLFTHHHSQQYSWGQQNKTDRQTLLGSKSNMAHQTRQSSSPQHIADDAEQLPPSCPPGSWQSENDMLRSLYEPIARTQCVLMNTWTLLEVRLLHLDDLRWGRITCFLKRPCTDHTPSHYGGGLQANHLLFTSPP